MEILPGLENVIKKILDNLTLNYLWLLVNSMNKRINRCIDINGGIKIIYRFVRILVNFKEK